MAVHCNVKCRRTSRTSAAGVPGAFSLEMANKLKKFREQSKLTQTALLAVTFSADAEELKKLGEVRNWPAIY
jgi:hypothetical protein